MRVLTAQTPPQPPSPTAPAPAPACRFARGADSLLDLACGRGGDIQKWFDCNIGFVKGIDLSPGEVAEARQRYQETRRKRPGAATVCEFADTPTLGLQEWKDERLYDSVTCMFALHYFFVTETALRQFLRNVAANLKPGGYFIGTVPDGKRVNECIRSSKVFSSPMLRIEARWVGSPQTFGSPYLCAIGDTVTGGEVSNTVGSLEYLVYSNVLQGVAAQYGLRPVLDYQEPRLEDLFDPGDSAKLLKHFAPHFPGSDPSLERASALFTAFVFRKEGGSQAEAPAQAAAVAAAASEAAGKGTKRSRDEGAAGEQEQPGPAAAPVGREGEAGQHVKPPSFKRPQPRRRPGQAQLQAAPEAGAASGQPADAPP